ncbi:MAG: hypothetical protein SGPRY_012610, partial [Prymnesium sp.]
EHWRWVEEALISSDADYLVVGGHYPVHSPSGHGPSSCLLRRLKPLLEQAQASVYFSGHDHCLFHIEERHEKHSPQFHGVGAGVTASKSLRHLDTVPPNSLRFFYGGAARPLNIFSGGFAGVSVSASELTIVHFNAQGVKLHQAS